ncbi:MAG: hypothetical protein GXO62_00700 [Epsilonproteobacteria bacterium]|nr:hypothetical protein [Campylobacterota bacterium]
MDLLNKIEKLDQKELILAEEFINQLLKKENYKKIKQELNQRREEIKKGDILTHEEIWDV